MYKKILTLFLSLIVLWSILVFLPLYINDPLQLFHKDYKEKTSLSNQMRYQAAGLINNFDYNSIILGTSMLANTSSSEAGKYLGGKFLNISIFGGDFHERSLLLKYTLRKKPIRTVLYSIDNFYLSLSMKNTTNYEYLYDENQLNDFKAYLNKKYLFKCLLGFSKKEKCYGYETDLDRPDAWYKNPQYIQRFGGLNKWLENQDNPQAIQEFKDIASVASNIKQGKKKESENLKYKLEKAKRYIDINILNIVKQYPNTKFILVFPPYSRVIYSQWAQYDLTSYKIHQYTLRYLAQSTKVNKNIEVYSWEDSEFLSQIENYKDPGHYSHEINTWMLQEIQKKQGILTSSNIDDFLQKTKNKNESFDLINIGKQIDIFYNSKRVLHQ